MIFSNPADARRGGRGRLVRCGAAALLVAVSSATVGVCWASAQLAARAAASTPPSTVTATQVPPSPPALLHPGTVVSSKYLGNRMFVNTNQGFALANTRGTTYPAATVNGGKTWRIDGPAFHVSAANAPNVVTQIGAASPSTYFAYGGPSGAESVVVSTNAGKQWWRAYMPGVALAVVYGPVAGTGKAGLLAFVESGPSELWLYASTDGGRRWSYRSGVLG